MEMRVADVAHAMNARLTESPHLADSKTRGLQVDSRLIGAGDIFVAIRGARVDGHAFARSVIDQGAVAVVADHALPDIPSIVVENTTAALGRLAQWYRLHVLRAQVVGITGSSGKTTTKDLVAQCLSGNVVAAQGSFNTEIGLPLTVLQGDTATDFLVLEMGMRGLGHIRLLADIAKPSIGVVLNVGSAHAGKMQNPEDIAQAKSELVEALDETACAVLNRDDPKVAAMARVASAPVTWFGRDARSDIRASNVELDSWGRPTFQLHAPGASAEKVAMQCHGEHFVSSALATAATCFLSGMETREIAERLSRAKPNSPWRMQVERNDSNITVVNDSYNANPESVRAALSAISSMSTSGRRWAVLGEMRELGTLALDLHAQVGSFAAGLGIDRLICVGEGARSIDEGAKQVAHWSGESTWVATQDDATEMLFSLVEPGDIILVKASRAVGLETVAAEALKIGVRS